ncbi:MAG: DNA N-6-adenine-methyltransferase [Sedimenticola sp.]
MLQQSKQNCGLVKARFLACIIVQIGSLQNAVGAVVRLKTRRMYSCLLQRASWQASVMLDDNAIDELVFWKQNCRELNNEGMYFETYTACDTIMYSDASGEGFGGYLALPDHPQLEVNIDALCESTLVEGSEVMGTWTLSERGKSSTWRELESVRRIVSNHADLLAEKKVGVLSDNQNVCSILKVGSRKANLQDIAVDIRGICDFQNIAIVPKWVPRADNMVADRLSKTYDCDDWQIAEHVFSVLNVEWGPFDVDRFASNLNNKCVVFNSKWWCPGTSGVDAFEQNWQKLHNWVVPPPSLILRVVEKFQGDGASGTLVVPEWKSSPYWPAISQWGSFARCITEIKNLGYCGTHVVVGGKGNKWYF